MNKWKGVLTGLQLEAVAAGLDIVVPFNIHWYNAVVAPELRMPVLRAQHDLDTHGGLGVMIGNTRFFWEPYVQWYQEESKKRRIQHPIQTYVRQSVQKMVDKLVIAGSIPRPCKQYWSHETEKGKLVAIQKLLVATGFAAMHEPSHLCIHPVYGSWFAIRTILLFDMNGPDATPPPPCNVFTDPKIDAEVRQAMEQALLSNRNERDSWKKWLAIRNALHPFHPQAYSASQTWYHYNHTQMNAMELALALQAVQPPTDPS